MASITLENYHKDTIPKVGSYICADTWGERGISGVDLIASDWSKAQFRAPLAYDIAVSIKVTGRTVQTDSKMVGWVRVEIEFVGDCEPSEFVRGWMRVH